MSNYFNPTTPDPEPDQICKCCSSYVFELSNYGFCSDCEPTLEQYENFIQCITEIENDFWRYDQESILELIKKLESFI